MDMRENHMSYKETRQYFTQTKAGNTNTQNTKGI